MMAGRISPKARPGSLLKGERKPGAKRDKAQDYLALIRKCPCLACDNDPAGEAAHLRLTAPSKPNAGVGKKPDDVWVLPLCADCHRKQHRYGEAVFWRWLGINPLTVCQHLWACDGIEAMRSAIFAARENRK
jgi:hypothetical protein